MKSNQKIRGNSIERKRWFIVLLNINPIVAYAINNTKICNNDQRNI